MTDIKALVKSEVERTVWDWLEQADMPTIIEALTEVTADLKEAMKECERCWGDGIYFICSEQDECDPDGCQRVCDCESS